MKCVRTDHLSKLVLIAAKCNIHWQLAVQLAVNIFSHWHRSLRLGSGWG